VSIKKNKSEISFGVQPFLALLAMWITQDVVMRFFFSKKIIRGEEYLSSIKGSVILAPTHRSRWDGLILTYATGRRITKKDCRFMVTTPEMKGIQGWFLKRLGCFSINQASPTLFSLRHAINLIISQNQLVIFPEGKINKHGKKIKFKQGLFRLSRLASKKVTSVHIVPIGIAYSRINPRFRDEVALCIEKPLKMDDFEEFSINDFNDFLSNKINAAELNALSLVGR
tara:strand:+ start:4440 stop:5120 length:681 start_codon:yes stop_codon:yes gene_type:complete